MSCLSVDWLTISVKQRYRELFEVSFQVGGNWYSLIPKQLTNNIFGKHYSIEKHLANGEFEQVAVYSFAPKSKILPEVTGHMKIINRYLYQGGDLLIQLVEDLIKGLRVKFHSIVRYDVAYDFRTFWNGRTVPYFFRKFTRDEWIKEKSCRVDMVGHATWGVNLDYIKFGSRYSPVFFVVYNKTKELKERTYKPYIVDRWKDNDLGGDEDVYRIEFVLHPNKMGLVNTSKGEPESGMISEFTDLEFLRDKNVEKLFWTLFQQYFVFCVNDHQARKDRMKKVKFFNVEKINSSYERVVDKTTSNRMDKIVIRAMYEMERDWRSNGKDISLQDAISNKVSDFGLESWVEKVLCEMDIREKKMTEKEKEDLFKRELLGSPPEMIINDIKLSVWKPVKE